MERNGALSILLAPIFYSRDVPIQDRVVVHFSLGLKGFPHVLDWDVIEFSPVTFVCTVASVTEVSNSRKPHESIFRLLAEVVVSS